MIGTELAIDDGAATATRTGRDGAVGEPAGPGSTAESGVSGAGFETVAAPCMGEAAATPVAVDRLGARMAAAVMGAAATGADRPDQASTMARCGSREPQAAVTTASPAISTTAPFGCLIGPY